MRNFICDFEHDFASPSEWAYMYRSLGLQVVPAKTHKESPNNWKRPALISWQAQSMNGVEDSLFASWYGEEGSHKSRDNMGILTGQSSGSVFVVDLDMHKNPQAQAWWDEMLHKQKTAAELVTVEQKTGGGGIQLFYRAPNDWSPPTLKTALGVDIRGQGGFAMLPPSLHESGIHYRWKNGSEPWNMEIATAPAWLCLEVDKLKHDFGAPSSSINASQHSSTPGITRNAFGLIIDGREAYMTRLVWACVLDKRRQSSNPPTQKEIEELIHETFGVYERAVKSRIDEPGTAKHILLERENRGISLIRKKVFAAVAQWGGKIKQHADQHPVISDFDVIEYEADENGQIISHSRNDIQPTSDTKNQQDIAPLTELEPAQLSFPKHLEYPPGIVGKIADTILRQANRYLPRQTAIGAAICILGHASQNKFVVGSRRTPLGIYVMSIAQTGAGKGDCMGTAIRLLRETGAEGGIHGAHASSAALHRALANLQSAGHRPCSFTILDEIGLKLQQRLNAGDVHTGPLVTSLLELFGKGSSDVPAKTYADPKRNIALLRSPLLTILGFTTPEPLNKALTSADACSGFANRFLLIEADGQEMRLKADDDVSWEVSQDLIDFFRSLDALDIGRLGAEKQQVIMLDEQAKMIMEELKCQADDAGREGGHLSALWTRAYQNALAVSAILALGESSSFADSKPPIIKTQHARYAADLVRWSVLCWSRRFGEEVADGPQEAERLKVLKLIRTASSGVSKSDRHFPLLSKGHMPHSRLLKRSKLDASKLKMHLETLIYSEQVMVARVNGNSQREIVCYFIPPPNKGN